MKANREDRKERKEREKTETRTYTVENPVPVKLRHQLLPWARAVVWDAKVPCKHWHPYLLEDAVDAEVLRRRGVGRVVVIQDHLAARVHVDVLAWLVEKHAERPAPGRDNRPLGKVLHQVVHLLVHAELGAVCGGEYVCLQVVVVVVVVVLVVVLV